MADERKPVRFRLGRRPADPANSSDPRVIAVLAQLDAARERAAEIVPPAGFRDELRAQLVAITPRIVAESAAENAPAVETKTSLAPQGMPVLDRPRPTPGPATSTPPAATSAKAPRRSPLAALRSIPLARPLAIAASIVALLALVLGGAVWMSQDAVPGDALYGLKRTSEDVRLSFADTDAERASDKLEFAQTRVEEARTLVGRPSAAGSGALAAGRISAETAALVTSALASADADTREATSLLGSEAVKSASPGPLASLTDWAPSQLSRLRDLQAAAPEDAKVSTATAQSMALLQAASRRAAELAGRVDCNCLKGGPSDAYGPLPAPTSPSTLGNPGASSPATGGAPSTAPSLPSGQKSSGGSGKGSSDSPGQLPTKLPTDTSRVPDPSLPPDLPEPTGRPSLGDLCKINILGIRVCPSTAN